MKKLPHREDATKLESFEQLREYLKIIDVKVPQPDDWNRNSKSGQKFSHGRVKAASTILVLLYYPVKRQVGGHR